MSKTAKCVSAWQSYAGLGALILMTAASAAPSNYGTTNFPVTGTAAAQEHFIPGLLMLHNFEYDDAREVFLEVQKRDPDLVMAYWGEALTYEHPLWREQDLDHARAALAKIAPTPAERVAKAATPREKAYIDSVNILFGKGTDEQRDYRYSAALKNIMETYPEDFDAAALYALSILATSHDGREFAKYMEAAAVTEAILDKAPRHPGALHYNIHCYDDPVHSPLGLRAANVYSEVAPSAVHALHMPAHIYFALGQFDRANELNARSYQAAEDRLLRKQIPIDRGAYHSLTWLMYGLTQGGNSAAALARLSKVAKQVQTVGDLPSRNAFATARAGYIIDTGDWDSPLADVVIDDVGLYANSLAADQYFQGVYAIKHGRTAKAEAILNNFIPVTDSGSRNARSVAPVLLRQMLEAQIAIAGGEKDRGLGLLLQAADREDQLSPRVGPPIPVQPAAELIADELLASGDIVGAQAYYERTLQRAVGRLRSIAGLQKATALAAAGD